MYAAYYSKKTTQQNNEIADLIQKAEFGDAYAQCNLGIWYENRQNYYEAVRWYKKATGQGNVTAQYLLGNCYFYGHGVNINYKKAAYFYRKATEQGNQKAQKRLNEINKLLQQNTANTKKTQNTNASVSYAARYNSEKTTQQSNNIIINLQQRAEKGDITSQCELGDCYYYGYGLKESRNEAVKWYRKAAEHEHAIAQYNLGYCYYYGRAGKQSYKKAVYWYEKAAEQGETAAQYKLGDCYYYGLGVKRNYKKAVYWYRKAAEHGHAIAQYYLGLCYYHGNGVIKNYNEATKWFDVAKKSNSTTKKHLTKLAKTIKTNINSPENIFSSFVNTTKHYLDENNYENKENYEINKQSQQNTNVSASYTTYYNEKPTQQNNEIADLIQKAQAGDVEALCKLGTHYYNGNKVEQNYNEAISSLIKCLQIIEEKHNATIKHRVEDIFKILNTINYLNNQSIKDKENDLSISFRNTLISLCNNFIPEYNKYISKDYLDKLECINYDFQIDYKLLLLDEFFYLCDLFKTSDLPKYLAVRLFDCHKKTDNSQKINALNNFESFKDSEEEYSKLKKINVAICATMSSGKSTFVNALLGNDYLPAKNEATTATITSVYDKDYSDNLLGCIKKGNDLIPCGKDVTLKDIENWNTDKNVSQIYLQGDLDNIGNKGAVVCVHDTPGTNNSSDSTHHDITMNFLNENKMDLIIYVSNAEHLGVEDEKQLLTEIKKLETPVLFIINKADSIDFEKEDFDKIKNQYCKYLQDIGFKNPNVLPVSAKAARLLKMSLKDKAELFTEDEIDNFVSYYRKFTKRIDLSNNSNIKNPYTTNETICIESKNYNKQDIFNALNKTGITKIEQTIENYIK